MKPLVHPVPTGVVGNKYGPRKPIDTDGDGVLDTAGLHGGLDFPARLGAPIFAAAAGRVVKGNYDTGAGKYAIQIAHPQLRHLGIEATGYAHGSARYVQTGQLVEQGQLIGRVGAEGRSTGPHLHLDVFADLETFRRIDPLPLVDLHPPIITNPQELSVTRMYRRTSTGATIVANVSTGLLWHVPDAPFVPLVAQLPGVLDKPEIVELGDTHFRMLVQLAAEGHDEPARRRVLALI